MANVTTEQIKAIKPGRIQPFICDNAAALNSACAILYRMKRLGMPKGVVNYEAQKFYDLNILLIRAMRPGDDFVLNK